MKKFEVTILQFGSIKQLIIEAENEIQAKMIAHKQMNGNRKDYSINVKEIIGGIEND